MNSSSTKSDCAEQRAQFRIEVVTYRSEHTIRATMELAIEIVAET